jgi:signal transduction histidine kinase
MHGFENSPEGDEACSSGTQNRHIEDRCASLAFLEEKQRRAIAEDLHDHLGHALALLRMKLVETQGNAVFCGLDQAFDGMKSLLDQIIAYTRFLTFELSPPVLSELGFCAGMEWLAERYSTKGGIRVVVSVSEDAARPPEGIAMVVFRCAMELVANITKHAGASLAEILVHSEGDKLILEVSDDGAGFDPESRLRELSRENKFGLLSVRERAKSMGGDMRIESGLGRGTKIILSIPVSRAGG